MLKYVFLAVLLLVTIMGLIVFCLISALNNSTRQISRINEQLLIVLGTRDGNDATGRALVASAKQPKKDVPGIANKKPAGEEKPKEGLRITVGSR